MTSARQRGRRPRGSRDPWKAAFFAVAAVALAGGTIWALLGSSFFVVRGVVVLGVGSTSAHARAVHLSGERRVTAAQVRGRAGLALGSPLVSVNTGAVARKVEKIAQVRSARVTRSWPGTIVIVVNLRDPVLAVPERGGFDVVDVAGVVVGRTTAAPSEVPVLASASVRASRLRGDAAVRVAGTVVRELPAWLRRKVRSVRVPVTGSVTLTLTGGMTVVWGGSDRSAAKAAEMAVLLRTKARYYDVSDPAAAVTSDGSG